MQILQEIQEITRNPKGSVANGWWEIPMHYAIAWFKCKLTPPKRGYCRYKWMPSLFLGHREQCFSIPITSQCKMLNQSVYSSQGLSAPSPICVQTTQTVFTD